MSKIKKKCIHTHTHTYTHIYIHVYIKLKRDKISHYIFVNMFRL